MGIVLPIVLALITSIFGPIAVQWAKEKLTKASKDDTTPIQEALELNKQIDLQLDNIMSELEPDSVWIAQFHNGGHFYPTGKSIQKFSIFYEKVTVNTESIQTTFQNIPVSIFPKCLTEVHGNGELCVEDFSTATETYGLSNLVRSYSYKSIYMVALYDLTGHMIGLMFIGFKENQKTLSEDEWIYVRQKVGVIGTLLHEYLTAKKIN
jgi:uncharacterized protein (DUF2141 family)